MNSKNKGNSFERNISKQLSNWISNNTNSDILWRSINSGAYATNKYKNNQNTNNQDGDLQSIHELGNEFINKFKIECKHYKIIDLYKLFKNNSEIYKWWYQLNQNIGDKHPLLIFKANNKDILVMCNQITFNCISYIYEDFYDMNYIKIDYEPKFIFKFDEFIKTDYKSLMYEIDNYCHL